LESMEWTNRSKTLWARVRILRPKKVMSSPRR
jgi:hypothetical protein